MEHTAPIASVGSCPDDAIMKYVDWVQVVADAYASNPGGSNELVGTRQIAKRMGIGSGDPRDDALAHALDDLRGINALEFDEYESIKPTAATWQTRDGVRVQSEWPRLIAGPLNAEREAVLAAAVRLSEVRHDD